MTDSIFTDDELKADLAGADEAPTPEQIETEEQRARDEQGRFAAKPAEEAPEGEAAEEGERHEPGTVPKGALHAEREKRKGIEAELKTAREQLAAIAEMRRQIAERAPEPLPDANDPAAVEHLRTRLAETEQSQNRITQRLDMDAADRAEMQQIGAVITASETQFRQTKPDYDDAINHVVEARARELQMYGLTPAQIQETVTSEALDIVRSAVQQGRDPAEMAYAIAQSRGYRPGNAAPAPGGAAATLAAIEQARGSNRSLGGAAGATPQQINAESIAAMSGDEFEQLYSTPEGRRMIDNL